MAPNAGGNTTRPGLRNPGELNYQVGSQSDQNEYVSQAHDEYGSMPPPINPPHLVGPLQQFSRGSRPPESEAPVPSPGLVAPRIVETQAAQLAALLSTQVQRAVEKQMGKISHQSVMPPSPAISSEGNDASLVRSNGAASQRIPTVQTEPTVKRMEFTPKHSHELSCLQLARELKPTQRRMEEMERSLRAEICNLREEIRAYPRVPLSRENVRRVTRDRRRLNSDKEFGFTPGAEELIQDVLDREFTPCIRIRTRRRRLSTRSDLELESSTDSDQDRNQDETPSRQHSWKGPRKRGLGELRTTHDKFRHALSYRTYRLQNTDSTQHRDVFANSYKQRRRIEAKMRDAKFDESKPIEALSFLRMFKTQCDKNAISEGAALLLLPDFLVGDAEQTYQNELELGDEGVGGITSYCHAVQFILRRYGADRYIERAVEEFENVRQKDDEDETAYARRLRSKAKCFGGVYSEGDLITRFIRGLDPALKPLLSAERKYGLRSCRTFYDVVDRAAGLGDSKRAMVHRATRRQKTTQNLCHCMDRVSSIEPATRSRT